MELYETPRNMERFQAYLSLLQGGKTGDFVMPISGFNPMAKTHVLQKLAELQQLGAEEIIQTTLTQANKELVHHACQATFQLSLTLADDAQGGWTNRFTTDYDSKFKLKALIDRKFCTPFFWSSENYTTELIKDRTLQAIYRTVYCLDFPKPKTLAEHIAQEQFVAKKCPLPASQLIDFQALDFFFQQNKDTTNFPLIFTFLYGDEAAISLGYSSLGIQTAMAGFHYAAY